MVEEYVKDLYRIGLILFVTPFAPILLGIAWAVLGQPIDFDSYNTYMQSLGASALVLVGFLIMLYLSIKYYYKEGGYGKS